ncbi:hypothetical protein Gotur_021089 [Gossypium turneri]
MQDPRNLNLNPDPAFPSFTQNMPSFSNPAQYRGSYHRRAQSEVQFRIPDDMDLVSDPFEGLGSEDDMFCSYMDIEMPGESAKGIEAAAGSWSQNPKGEEVSGGSGIGEKYNGGGKGRHRYSNSVDGCSIMESIEAKKAMAPDKLAELWTIDPKRAKRDTTGLTTENAELKLRLQAMEQQAQLSDALNEALKKEVERLKTATGEITTPTDTFNLGMHHISYAQSSFFPPQNTQLPPFNPFHSNLLTSALNTNSHALADVMQQDPLGLLQGLDTSSRGSPFVKSESPSICAAESSGTVLVGVEMIQNSVGCEFSISFVGRNYVGVGLEA